MPGEPPVEGLEPERGAPPMPEFVLGEGTVAAPRGPSRAAWIVATTVLVLFGASAAAAWFIARSGGPDLRSIEAVPADAVAAIAINTDLSSQAWLDARSAFERLGLGAPEDALRDVFDGEDVDFQTDVAPLLGGDLTFAVLEVPGIVSGLAANPLQALLGAGADVPADIVMEDAAVPVVVAILRPADVVAAEAAVTRLLAADEAAGEEPSFTQVLGEYIVISNAPEGLAAVMDVVNGAAPGLAETDAIAGIVDGLPRSAVSVLIASPANLPVEAFAPPGADPECDRAADLEAMAFGAAITIDDAGFHLQGVTVAPEGGTAPAESRLLPELPAGVEVLFRATGVGSGLRETVRCLDPEMRAGLADGLAEAGLTLDQVVAAIGEEVAVAIDTSTLGDGPPQFLLLLELADPAVARQALDAASATLVGTGALEQTADGYRFTELESGISVVAEVRDDALVVASGIDTAAEGPSIAADARLPEGAPTDSFLAWVDLPAIVNLIYSQIGDEPVPSWVAELESWSAEAAGDEFRFDVTLTPADG